MKFLVDAHFPIRLARQLRQNGFEAMHTLEFPNQNRTSDEELMDFADVNDYIVLTKDADFVDGFYLRAKPRKLLLMSTGNISNKDLEHLMALNLPSIETAFEQHNFVEINRSQLIVHV